MPHIFDPFFRASNVKNSKGYGIGLPLAQNIIRLRNGAVHISSRKAEGTEVVVKIPRELVYSSQFWRMDQLPDDAL